jgi:uncharacterized protein (TIRG00374 family)
VRSWAVWAGLVVSAAFAYLAVRNAQLDEVWAALKESDYLWLFPALGALALWFVTRTVRWQSLFAAARRPPFRPTAGALFAGYLFNNLLPARAGEVVRVIALNRTARTSYAEATGTVVVERVFDVLSLLLLLFLMLPWLPDLGWVRAAGVLAAALLALLVAAVVVLVRFGEQPLVFVARQLARIPGLSEERLRHGPSNLVLGLRGFLHPGTALVAFGWTTVSWIVLGAGFWFVMLAFDLGLSPLAGELVVIAIGLAMILPSSPAALGVFEGATVIALGAYGVPDSEALSYALVLHALNALPFLALAIPALRVYRPLLATPSART